MKTFKELKETYGLVAAKQIRDNKKALQEKKLESEPDWWQKHPELPDNEAWVFLQLCSIHCVCVVDTTCLC